MSACFVAPALDSRRLFVIEPGVSSEAIYRLMSFYISLVFAGFVVILLFLENIEDKLEERKSLVQVSSLTPLYIHWQWYTLHVQYIQDTL